MPSQVDIRPAVSSDIDALTSLLEILFSIEEDFFFNQNLQRQGLELMLTNERCCVLVADVNGQAVGMCSGQLTISTAEGGLSLLVEDVVVDTLWRGQGVGRLLMEAMNDWAMGNNVSRLQLLADQSNTPALDFYRRLGWKATKLICLRTYTSCRGGA